MPHQKTKPRDDHPGFEALERIADAAVVDAMRELVRRGSDADLTRINVYVFAEQRGLPEDRVLDAFVHASRIGLFELTWSLLCPGCGGVLGANTRLEHVREVHNCSLCADAYQPTLDEMVDASFTVSPSVRAVGAHDPGSLSHIDFYHQLHFNQALVLPAVEEFEAYMRRATLVMAELQPGEAFVRELDLEPLLLIVFDGISHGCAFLDSREAEPLAADAPRQEVTVLLGEHGATPDRVKLRPGPARLVVRNVTQQRLLPAVFIAGQHFHEMMAHRRRFLTARDLFSNQAFRDVYGQSTLAIDQRLRITSLTVLFTDLKGSTALYARVGDLAAYDMVQAHFAALARAVHGAGGAIVKTIGDAVMATFPTPERGMFAGLRMIEELDALNASRGYEALEVSIGLHAGPCLAVQSNDRLDYFGQTVNIAARVQGQAEPQTVFTTDPILDAPGVTDLLAARGLAPEARQASLKGIEEAVTVYRLSGR